MVASQRSNSVPGSATFSCKSLLFFYYEILFCIVFFVFSFSFESIPHIISGWLSYKKFSRLQSGDLQICLMQRCINPILGSVSTNSPSIHIRNLICFFAPNPNKIYSESILQINGKRLVKKTAENGAFFYLNSSWKPHIDCINNQCEGSTRPPLALPLISKSEKGQKDSFLNGDSERDLCDAGEVLCQLGAVVSLVDDRPVEYHT